MFTFILNNFPNNLEQKISTKMEGCGEDICGPSFTWIASTLGNKEFIKLLIAIGANIEHTTQVH